MCGIVGFSFLQPNSKVSERVLSLEKSLFHRGPDSSGSFINKNLTLIHTRLSIIDLNSGSQPIENEKYILVANGEIYNDLEIRKENKSYKYLTNSDSESILALYDQNGVSGLSKLRGMYAFAIYDKKKGELILARDEFGIKPLYFSNEKEGIIFCSEINPIQKFKKKKCKISDSKLAEFMQIQYCTGTSTIYEDINRVGPGQILIIKNGRIKKSLTNHLPKKKPKKINDNLINHQIKESIASHLRSDVPYCIFFSGGIDSMLLLYYINVLKKKNVTAYSVYFDNDTVNYLDQITANLNVDLVKIKFSESDFWDWLLFAAGKIDEPIADYAILPTFKLASIAAKKFKVVITGEGGDELFAGYGRYKKTQRIIFKKTFFPKATFNSILKHKFANWTHDLKIYNSRVLRFGETSLQRSQYFDYNNWLPNDLLIKLDRCLMTYGIEGRTPFIDKELFKNFFYINDKLKIKKGFGKFYIRNFLKRKISYYNSFEKKKGFSVPIHNWLPKRTNDLEKVLINQDFLRKYFSKDELHYIIKGVKKDKKFVKPLWHIIFFTSWYLTNIKGIKPKGNFFDVLS